MDAPPPPNPGEVGDRVVDATPTLDGRDDTPDSRHAVPGSRDEAPGHRDRVVDATLTSSLDSLDDALNYRDWIVELVRPHVGGDILELGAGHGTFTTALAELGSSVTAVEPGRTAHERLAERVAGLPTVCVVPGVLDDVDPAHRFDAVVMINVLEHIDDDVGTVADVARRVRPGGTFAVWVPAFPLLYSAFDDRLGHHRRYRRPQLEQLLTTAGFDVVESRYVNAPGWISWLLLVRLLRVEPTGGRLVRLFDRAVVPLVRAIESRWRAPFGQSVLVIGRRRGTVD